MGNDKEAALSSGLTIKPRDVHASLSGKDKRMVNILIQLLENHNFMTAFCEGCDAQYRIPENRLEPGEDCCPTDFDIEDPACNRNARWQRIVDAVEAAVARSLEEGAA